MLLACDQSVRGFAIAAAPAFWGGDWSLVRTARYDGGQVKRKDEEGALQRLRRVFNWVDEQICLLEPNEVGFESYGFGSGADYHVVELVGALKLRLFQYQIGCVTVQQSSARKLIVGPSVKIPRKGDDAKKLMHQVLTAHGAPATISFDESDALVLLNSMLVAHGGTPLVKT